MKANLKRDVNIAVKNNISGYGNYLFGIKIDGLGSANKFSYGVQLDLNL